MYHRIIVYNTQTRRKHATVRYPRLPSASTHALSHGTRQLACSTGSSTIWPSLATRDASTVANAPNARGAPRVRSDHRQALPRTVRAHRGPHPCRPARQPPSFARRWVLTGTHAADILPTFFRQSRNEWYTTPGHHHRVTMYVNVAQHRDTVF